jgi:hypothetical protein
MGDIYVKTYAAHGCPDISGSAYRVLMRMAVVVYDEESEPGKDDEGLYFGGWKGLTAVLGYGVTQEWDEISPAAKRTITRAIRELRDHHYLGVAPQRTQREHGTRVYRLSLSGYALTWDIRGQSV